MENISIGTLDTVASECKEKDKESCKFNNSIAIDSLDKLNPSAKREERGLML